MQLPRGGAELPRVIRANLDWRFPGWRLALPRQQLVDVVNHTQSTTAEQLCVAHADFDGNGQTDYAVFLRVGESKYSTRLVLFLRKGSRYWHRTLYRDAEAGEMYVWVSPKGSRGMDYVADQPIVYRLPTLQFASEVAGIAFLYDRGRFRRVVTAD